MELRELIPKNKHDLPAIALAKRVGFPSLTPILPDLLEWTRDFNWPVAKGVFELLSEAGQEIAPCLSSIFKSDDSVWKYWLLSELCPKLTVKIIDDLRPDIIRLASYPTKSDQEEGVNIAAAALMVNKD